jgi:hypothetical protein
MARESHGEQAAGRGADLLQELDRRRADSAGGAVDEHVLATPDPGRPDRREGIARALAAGRRILEGQARPGRPPADRTGREPLPS